jgi:hypothetical protein
MRIVAGGQTGVDRAALDAAIERGVPYGGWCPQGGWAEDLPDPPGLLALYPGLRAAPERDPRRRTEWNIRDSDRLMVLVDRAGLPVSKGTQYALRCAQALGKPHVIVDLDHSDAIGQARAFLAQGQGAFALCTAGPRESEAPGIYLAARAFLRTLLQPVGAR